MGGGEGKVEYMDREFDKNNYCSICSQLAFDDSIKEIADFKDGILDKDDFYNYLSTHERTSKAVNYSEYFFGTNDINEIKRQTSEKNGGVGGTFGKMDLNKQFYVMMGITSGVNFWRTTITYLATSVVFVGGTLVVVSGAGLIAIPTAAVCQTFVWGAAAAGAVAGMPIQNAINPSISAVVVKGDGVENSFMAPTIIEANYEYLKALECENINTLA